MWKIEILNRASRRIIVIYKYEDGEMDTRGSIDIKDDAEMDKWNKAIATLNS